MKDVKTIMNLWKESQIEGDIAEVAKNIAHEYYYTDKPYIILPNSLGKISRVLTKYIKIFCGYKKVVDFIKRYLKGNHK